MRVFLVLGRGTATPNIGTVYAGDKEASTERACTYFDSFQMFGDGYKDPSSQR